MTAAPIPLPPTQLPAWTALTRLAAAPLPHLRDLPPETAAARRWEGAGLRLDASRQRLTPAVEAALLALAAESDVDGQRAAMFRGDAINRSENRPVLHVALRTDASGGPWDAAITRAVLAERERMLAFADALRAGAVRGHDGQGITDVVNLGIGGSDLGPRMVVEALAARVGVQPRVHFVSNPDAWALWSVLRDLDPARTLFIVASKTFTTPETLANAASARAWLRAGGVPEAGLTAHEVAITASPAAAAAHGHRADRTFLFWDWVGGRYSLWSALGLPIAIALGSAAFEALLAGARAMDHHFLETPAERNLPLRLALHGVWNRNFLGMPTLMLAPYAVRLARFTPFVQQLDMESNGKHSHADGSPVGVDTGPVVWGGVGIDGQHAYFQLLHQGRHAVPVEFIGVETDDCPMPGAADHQAMVTLNLRAQVRALAEGRTVEEAESLLRRGGMAPEEARACAWQRHFPGNTPSHQLWLPALDPASLGALIALYEHKVFVQAAVWRINAYDQWGVELGKAMAREMQGGA